MTLCLRMTAFHHLQEIKAPFQILVPTLFKCVSRVENSIKIPEGEMPIRYKDAKFCPGTMGRPQRLFKCAGFQALVYSLVLLTLGHFSISLFFFEGVGRWGWVQWGDITHPGSQTEVIQTTDGNAFIEQCVKIIIRLRKLISTYFTWGLN